MVELKEKIRISFGPPEGHQLEHQINMEEEEKKEQTYVKILNAKEESLLQSSASPNRFRTSTDPIGDSSKDRPESQYSKSTKKSQEEQKEVEFNMNSIQPHTRMLNATETSEDINMLLHHVDVSF